MATIFGYKVGTIGKNAIVDTSPNSTENSVDPSDFVLGDNILTLMRVKQGMVLKNKMGDSWLFNDVRSGYVLTSYENIFTFEGVEYKYTGKRLFLGYVELHPDDRNWEIGSYVFSCVNDKGMFVTGHPTRVFIDPDDNTNSFISANDTGAGIVEYKDDNPVIDYEKIKKNQWYAFALFLAREMTLEPGDTDPFKPGGNSDKGGGNGDFNNTSIPVNIPSLPSISAVSTGFITLFNPSIPQLRELANYMWSELFDLDTLRKLFADPMDAILGLSIVPVSVPNGGTSLVTVGNISTGVSMTKAASQYVTVDCGVINVNEYWGAYLDYDPFTKAEIYLPYIGTHPIAVDDIMGKSVHVVYHVDILSGACCAYIQCGESVLYSFIGQCSCSIPVTGNDWTNVINGALNIAGAIGSMVATGGATAPMAVGAIASTAVNSFKPAVEKSGSISGMGGMLGIQVPYLILTRPRQALPYNQNKFIGYPSFVTATLGELTGYTEVDSIHLEGIPATDDELSEIESLLKSGVIL